MEKFLKIFSITILVIIIVSLVALLLFGRNNHIETPTTKVASPIPYGMTGGILE